MGNSKNVDGRKLVVLSGRTKGTAFVLTKTQVNAGRESDNAVCLKGKRVSRYHAVLVRTNGEYTLRNVSPRVGTLLNGQPAKEAPLKLGDRIRIGEFEMSYEAATAPAVSSPSGTTLSQLDELTAPRLQVAPAKNESDDARALAERTAAELVCARVEAEKSASEYQQRIAELMQENERLVGEVNLANEAFASMQAQSQTRADTQLPALTEQLHAMSQENAALADRNTELQAKISELEESAKEARRLETELASAQTALQQMSEELAKTRKSTKLDVIAKELGRALQSDPAGHGGELERFQTALAEARGEWEKISDLHAKVEELAVENHELRIAVAKALEEAAFVKRCLSDQTNEEFDRIRRSLVAKRNEKPDKLSRFLRPFSATARAAHTS